MAEVASAYVSIMPSAKGFGSKLNSQVSGDLDSSGKKLGSRLGTAMKGGALAVLGGAALAGAFLKSAVGDAGELEQSVGAINTVFGDSAKQMHKWSKGAAQSVGLTQNEFNELGTLIGSQLKNGGTAMDELAPKTKNLVTMGADLSSMFGGSTKEAVEALSSALKGERDPIERYGVSLNQAKIDAEAAALGFEKVDGALSDQAKQAATLSLITKQTADAQGNFAKESDTLAGKQQRLSAQFGNFKATLGTALLPVITKVFGFLNDTALPAVSNLTNSLGKGSPIIKTVGGFVKNTLLPPIQDLAGWVTNRLVPAIQDFARDALPGVKSALDSVKKGLNSAKPFFQFLGDVVTNVLLPVLGKLARTILPLVGKQIETLGKAFGVLGRLGTALWNKALQPAFKFIVGGVASILNMWSSMLSILGKVPGFGWAKDAAAAMGNAADKARDMAAGIKKIPTSKTVNVTVAYKYTGLKSPTRGPGGDISDSILPRLSGSGNPAARAFNQILKEYGAAGQRLMERIDKGIKSSKPKVIKSAQDAFEGLRSKLETKRDDIKGVLEGLQDDFAAIRESVASAFTGDLFDVSATTDDAGNVTRTIGQNFVDGLMAKRSELTGLLSSFNVLKGWGIDPAFLTQLFASGQGAVITELAGMGQAGAVNAAGLFGEVISLGDQLGTAVAANDPVAAEMVTANKKLSEVVLALGYLNTNLDKKLSAAVERGAEKGTRAGNDDRNTNTRQRERAGR